MINQPSSKEIGKVNGVSARTGLLVIERPASLRRKPFISPCSDNWCDSSHPTHYE